MIKPGDDLVHTLSGKVVTENAPYRIRLFFIYYYFMILDLVTEGNRGRKKRPAFHAVAIAPADILGD